MRNLQMIIYTFLEPGLLACPFGNQLNNAVK